MRYLACVGVGLFVGLLCALMAMALTRPRDTYPRAMMNVMKHALGTARATAAGDCAGNESRLRLLGLLAADLEPAFLPGGEDERVFRRYADSLRARIAEATAAAACPAQATALTAVENACDDCHRDYR
ncbi:MAG TPA: hypothetical protein VMR06_10650 [Dokdonella sp.]|uniref:hypothetical protein n=1 Tax=Dokdonella sp. TaxID=2291710 RepID=UPI002BEED0C2|nr:hypothetical protein [Dokdonella sp.]HUD42439.1 hypothetical protein [Dokdonella sp.]